MVRNAVSDELNFDYFPEREVKAKTEEINMGITVAFRELFDEKSSSIRAKL